MLSMSCRRIVATVAVAWAAGLAVPALAETTLGWIELEKAPLEVEQPMSFLTPAKDRQPTLRDLVAAFDAAAERDDISGVVVRLREPALSMSQVEELGASMKQLRAAGKKVHLFTEIYGVPELVLGAHADEVIVQRGGAVNFHGLHMEEMFLADTLNLFGLKMDYVQVGAYKGASEALGRNAPSPEWEQNISQLLDGMYGGIRAHIKSGRGLTDAQIDRALERGWLCSPEEAVKLGLVDTVLDRMELDRHLERKYGEFEFETSLAPVVDRSADMLNPFTALTALFDPPKREVVRDTIAILHIDGAIIDGESSAGAMGGRQVGSLTAREALAEIGEEDDIRGLIVRIDSPGGSAIASESIWIGLRAVAEKKPVWVSVGSMAASGGYYCAVAGEKIYVNPTSIVGSIGVVGGKPVLAGLYDWGKVNVVERTRGAGAGIFSTKRSWSDAERGLIRGRMQETYEQFVARVTAGRDGIDISKTAEGRLFTGDKAIEMKMADKVGGVDVALNDMAGELGLTPGEFDVFSYPEPPTLAEVLEQAFGRFIQAPGSPSGNARPSALLTEGVAALRDLVGARSWPGVASGLEAMWQMRKEPVLLAMPRVLMFR